MADRSTKPGWGNREFEMTRDMSPAEAVMWRVGKDPWLDPSGAMLSVLDCVPDEARAAARLDAAMRGVPRMTERVVEPSTPLGVPHWEPCPDFNIDDHFSVLEVPAPGDDAAFMKVVSELYATQFDPARPPWHFWLLTGLAGDRAALLAKAHHSIADGIGGLRMAEAYLDLERDPAPVAPSVPEAADGDGPDDTATGPGDNDGNAVDGIAERAVAALGRLRSMADIPVELGRNVAAELAMIGADPLRVRDAGVKTVAVLREALDLVMGMTSDAPRSAWRDRSGDRVLATVTGDLDAAKAAAHRMGGTVNDLFVTAMAQAALDHHEATDGTRPPLSMSFVRSTRQGSGGGGNAFTPTFVSPLAGDVDAAAQFAHLHEAMSAARREPSAISLSSLSAVAMVVPTPALTRLTRDQAARLDIATSNIRSAPFPVYIAGAKVTETFAFGPLAGTACNATLVSYDGRLHLGLVVDPAAIPDIDGFVERVGTTLEALTAG